MIKYDESNFYVDNKEINMGGLNTSHVLWHISELSESCVSLFFNTLNDNYIIPSKINKISIASGKDFDALLVDDRMFRYNKIDESVLCDVQDYINKGAYATAITKLNETSNIIGSGLNHVYNIQESYTYLSNSYNLLFENTYKSNEKGRLVENFNNKINIYECSSKYARGINDIRYVEDWTNSFNPKCIDMYDFLDVKQCENNTLVYFKVNSNELIEACYTNANCKLLESGINTKELLKDSKYINSFRINTLLEYKQPFTLKDAVITSYSIDNNMVKFGMHDIYENKGTINAAIKISENEFKNKYSKQLDEIVSSTDNIDFEDKLEMTIDFFKEASDDIASFSRIKNMERSSDESDEGLSYKVREFTPNNDGDTDLVFMDNKNKNRFKVSTLDLEGKPYSITYEYIGEEPIREFIQNINDEAEDYDFSKRSEVVRFYKVLNYYGVVKGSYPMGISTKDRMYKKNIQESEGVQVSDIAPKLDQNIKLVKMKKRKSSKSIVNENIKLNINDLLINNISQEDEFYGSKGFIKDEDGKYHFGDYYINESGRVVHKSKLKENNIYYTGSNSYTITKPNDETTKIIELYIDHNKYTDMLIPINWNENKIRSLSGKLSNLKGPIGNRDLVKEVENEYKSKLKESINDDFYYKVNEISIILNQLKEMTTDKDIIRLIDSLYIPVSELQIAGSKSENNSESVI